jgi:lysophospholipase L1-like esterase
MSPTAEDGPLPLSRPRPRSKKNLRLAAVALAIVAATVETVSYLGQSFLASRGIIYQPPDRSRLREILKLRPDPRLGWPSPELFGKGNYDRFGSRVNPSFSDPDQEACVSAYGDSFTWGAEVPNDVAWSNVLSTLLHCRVSNFGVSGYGTDQAYLRFKYNARDRAKVVILGYFSENLVRNVNQYRRFLAEDNGYGLKPRFILENGSLKLVPLPALSAEEYVAMTRNPGGVLVHDYLLPGGPAGTTQTGFPFTISLFRTFANYRIRAQLSREPYWAAFYRRGHPSQALEVTSSIMQSFHRDARLSGRTPVIVLFPFTLDLRNYQKNKTWVYQPLLDDLHAHGIEALNIGEGLADHLGGKNPCSLFTECDRGHFNREGNAVTAKLIARYLSSRHLLANSGF